MKSNPLLSTAIFSTMLLGLATFAQAEEGWVSLFDGETLKGWTQKNGMASYKVVDGTIVGKTKEGSPNSFLCSDKDYGNFELEFEVNVQPGLNSGVQIRSRQKDKTTSDKKNDQAGRVFGPQVELEASGEKGAEAGYVYGEATGRGWLTPADRLKPHKHYKDGEWNQVRVVADGPTIKTWINGQPIEELTDEEAYKTHPRGFLGLQVHGIRAGAGPYQVAWRNLRIKEK